MKALSLAVAAATTLATSVAFAQTTQTNAAPSASPSAPQSAQSAQSSQTPQGPQTPAATEPLPALPPAPSPAVTPPATAIAPESTLAEANRGGRGESCRARSDCKTGLACFENVCSFPEDRKTCASDSECGDLACVRGLCSSHPPATESSSGARKTTIDLDETISSRSTFVYGGYPGVLGYSDFGPSQATETAASSIFGVRHRIGSLELEGAIPLAFIGRTNSTLSAALGNLTAGAYFAHETENIRIRVGGGIAFPTAGTSSDSRRAERAAAYARGLDRSWHWSPSSVSLTPGVLIGSRSDAVFQHATEAVLAPLFPSDNGTALVVVQLSEDLGAHAGLFRGGARAEVVTSTASGSVVQVSVLPYVGVEGSGGFADIGLLVNLSEPAGFSFDETKYWGLRLRGGLRF